MISYGLDLGTSNCLVAKVEEKLDGSFEVKCLNDDEGNESFPSIVYFEDENNYKVGSLAENKLYIYPDSTVELVKIRLGKTTEIPIIINGNIINKSPQEISAYLLRHFNKLHNNQIKSALITVPAFFDQTQKDATMQAGIAAGMRIEGLIEEPTAAIMYHLFDQYVKKGIEWFSSDAHKNILVFDFGGGTLDLSLIKVCYANGAITPEVLEIGGDPELGGNIIDFIFTDLVLQNIANEYVNDKFIQEVKIAFENYYINYLDHKILKFSEDVSIDVKQYIFRLKRNIEQAKIKLSTEKSVKISFEGIYKPIIVTREDFEEEVLGDSKLSIKTRIADVLKGISKKRLPISQVILIGGSSQIPYVRELIFNVFSSIGGITKEKIIHSDDFNKAVAKGAAIQAALKNGTIIPPFAQNKCNSIVSRDIEIYHAGKSSVFIPKGTEYPFLEKKEFAIKVGHALNDRIDLCFNEIIEKEKVEKKEICQFSFFLPLYYTNDQIMLSMDINDAGLYQIGAMHTNTMESVEFEPTKRFSLSEAELNELVENLKGKKDISK